MAVDVLVAVAVAVAVADGVGAEKGGAGRGGAGRGGEGCWRMWSVLRDALCGRGLWGVWCGS